MRAGTASPGRPSVPARRSVPAPTSAYVQAIRPRKSSAATRSGRPSALAALWCTVASHPPRYAQCLRRIRPIGRDVGQRLVRRVGLGLSLGAGGHLAIAAITHLLVRASGRDGEVAGEAPPSALECPGRRPAKRYSAPPRPSPTPRPRRRPGRARTGRACPGCARRGARRCEAIRRAARRSGDWSDPRNQVGDFLLARGSGARRRGGSWTCRAIVSASATASSSVSARPAAQAAPYVSSPSAARARPGPRGARPTVRVCAFEG